MLQKIWKTVHSPEDGKGPGADLAFLAIPLPDHPEVGVLPEAVE